MPVWGRFVPVVFGIGFLALFAIGLTLGSPQDIDSAYKNKALPAFTLAPLFDGGDGLTALNLRSGEPILLNIFASWCAPCRAEAPALEALSQQLPVIGIAYKDRPEDTDAFLRQYGNPFSQIAVDFEGQAALRWGLYGVPETYILNKQGKVILRHAGPIDKGVMDRLIMPAIENAR